MKKTEAYQATKVVDFKQLRLTSPAFDDNGMIPSKYTCDGANINPRINISGIPKEVKTIAVIVDDPDAPSGTFCHWVVWNIPVTYCIREQEKPGTNGMNDYGHHQYDGPYPPSGTHRYYFKVYALDCALDIPTASTKADLEKAMSGHVLAFGCLTGRYRKGDGKLTNTHINKQIL